MKLYLETPVLRVITKKLGDAISDLDAKIADSPPFALLFGVEKKKIIATPFASFDARDIRPFLNKDLIKRIVDISKRTEGQKRQRSFLAQQAYETEETSDIFQELLSKPKDELANELLRRLKRNNIQTKTA